MNTNQILDYSKAGKVFFAGQNSSGNAGGTVQLHNAGTTEIILLKWGLASTASPTGLDFFVTTGALSGAAEDMGSNCYTTGGAATAEIRREDSPTLSGQQIINDANLNAGGAPFYHIDHPMIIPPGSGICCRHASANSVCSLILWVEP